MTVKELKEELNKLDENAEVVYAEVGEDPDNPYSTEPYIWYNGIDIVSMDKEGTILLSDKELKI